MDSLTDYEQRVLSLEYENDNIQEIMANHKLEHNKLINEINTNSKLKCLHEFSDIDICNIIKLWIYNDINYNKYLVKTMHILSQCSLSGKLISDQPLQNVKLILEKELLTFMTHKTFNIIFRNLNAWKHEHNDGIKTKTAEQIGYILYNYPLNSLLNRINDNNDTINGQKYIQYYQDNKIWIEKATGWNKEDIYQIDSVLFKYHTLTTTQITENINNIQLIDGIISQFNLEGLHYNMKHGESIADFSDIIVNMVDEMMPNNEENNDFIKEIYESIAQCFIFNNKEIENNKVSSSRLPRLDQHQDWICSNCGNYNFIKLIKSTMNVHLEICTLCGIKQRDSIILQLKSCDTYIMVNDVDEDKDDDLEKKEDDIDILIQNIQKNGCYNLQCLNSNNNASCPAILRLAKYLIRYKRWIQTVYRKTNGDDATDKTIKVDIERFINDDIFKNVFIESVKKMKKMNENEMELLIKMFTDNKEDIHNIKTFIGLKRTEFAKLIQKHTKIKPSYGAKLYRLISAALKTQAQTAEFGEFLSDLDINIVDKDYHHILKWHVNNGNKHTIENVFRFFGDIVHYEDTQNEIAECQCIKRRDDRINRLISNGDMDEIQEQKETMDNNNDSEDKHIWSLKQQYMQCQLDIIHCYLVHSNWKYFVKRHIDQYNDDGDDEKEEDNDLESIAMDKEKQHKYITDLVDCNVNYGFGVDHSHPHLSPKYVCIRDEMLFNVLYSLTAYQFEILLIKAIKIHKIALGEDYKYDLFCKYYKWEYNIARNTAIGIRHILSIIIYTDVTKLCTAFRSTYRRINNEIKEEQVTLRHRELYHFARCLYEAVEFFGNEMHPQLQVYHGLNKMMKFNKFTAYFNEPISTTTSRATAHQLSEGVGIILTLKSGSVYFNKTCKIPKYLSISWCSHFPNEDEMLFYGENVVFQITDIIEAKVNKGHLKELEMFNRFQKTVQNQEVYWDDDGEDDIINIEEMIDALSILIKNQQERNKNVDNGEIDENKDDDDDEKESEYITKYGKELFDYFCNNTNTTSVGIKNYKTLPLKLKNALFIEENNKMQISLVPISFLFINLTDITLNDLNIESMTAEAKDYFNVVLEYINLYNSDIATMARFANLKQIRIQSEPQLHRKENSTLKKLAIKYHQSFQKLQWNVQYKFELTSTLIHSLIFIKKSNIKTKWKNNLYGNDDINRLNKIKLETISSEIHSKYDEPEFDGTLFAAENMKIILTETVSMDIITAEFDKKPSYFMQITSMEEDVFYIDVIAARIDNKMRRRLRIINVDDEVMVNKSITIYRKKEIGTTDIEIDEEHNKWYNLAIFDPKNTDDPFPNTNQLQFEILKDEKEYPPQNKQYKPNPIDLSTLLKVENDMNETIDLYWNFPTKSFGYISYKIINDNDLKEKKEDDDDIKEEEEEGIIIKLLPYSIPITSVPISFKIITISTINGDKYESDASEKIYVCAKGVYIKKTFIEAYQSEDHEMIQLMPEIIKRPSIATPTPLTPIKTIDIDIESKDNDNNENDENIEENDEDSRELLESFLDLTQPTINWKMIEFLSGDNITHLLLSYLSRISPSEQNWDINYDDMIPTTLPMNCSDIDEIRATKLSYSLIALLSNQNAEETVESYLLSKCKEICFHALITFHPLSNGNVYHGRITLEILFDHHPNELLSILTNKENIYIQLLFKCALFRNLHQGNLNSFILDLICFEPTQKDGEIMKNKLIKMLIEWKFIEYILSVSCHPKHGDDVATKYGIFFIDMTARCASIEGMNKLFDGYEYLIIDTFINGLFDKENKRTIWHRICCGQTLIQFLDILSRSIIIDPLQSQSMNINPDKNILHSMFNDSLQRLHQFIPKMCEMIINDNNKLNVIKLSYGLIKKPFGQIRLNCLELLTVSADFAQFECGKVLELMNNTSSFYKQLLNMTFIYHHNNLYLSHFRRLIHLTMIFRRRFLKYLFVNCSMLERFVHFYQNTKPRTELHGYIIQMLWDIYINDNNDDNNKYIKDTEDQWDIISYFNSSDIWKQFKETVALQIEIQQATEQKKIAD